MVCLLKGFKKKFEDLIVYEDVSFKILFTQNLRKKIVFSHSSYYIDKPAPKKYNSIREKKRKNLILFCISAIVKSWRMIKTNEHS